MVVVAAPEAELVDELEADEVMEVMVEVLVLVVEAEPLVEVGVLLEELELAVAVVVVSVMETEPLDEVDVLLAVVETPVGRVKVTP